MQEGKKHRKTLTSFADKFLWSCCRCHLVGQMNRPSSQFSVSRTNNCGCLTTYICQYIDLDERLTIRKLLGLSYDYNTSSSSSSTNFMASHSQTKLQGYIQLRHRYRRRTQSYWRDCTICIHDTSKRTSYVNVKVLWSSFIQVKCLYQRVNARIVMHKRNTAGIVLHTGGLAAVNGLSHRWVFVHGTRAWTYRMTVSGDSCKVVSLYLKRPCKVSYAGGNYVFWFGMLTKPTGSRPWPRLQTGKGQMAMLRRPSPKPEVLMSLSSQCFAFLKGSPRRCPNKTYWNTWADSCLHCFTIRRHPVACRPISASERHC